MYVEGEVKREVRNRVEEEGEGTINFLPVMVEGEDSGENVVRERHGLRGSVEHHAHKFSDIANEEAIRGSSDSLPREMALDFSGPPPEQDSKLKDK